MQPVNLCFEISRAGETCYEPFARLEHWQTGFVVRLRGFIYGRFFGIGHEEDKNQEFVRGDLIYYGPIMDNGKHLRQWCGAIWSDDNAVGNAAYNGVLKCSPFPLATMKQQHPWGIVLTVEET